MGSGKWEVGRVAWLEEGSQLVDGKKRQVEQSACGVGVSKRNLLLIPAGKRGANRGGAHVFLAIGLQTFGLQVGFCFYFDGDNLHVVLNQEINFAASVI